MCFSGRAKVIDGETIVVAGQMIRLRGLDAPELDQTFSWRGHQIGCGTRSLAALEVLIAGVKVRCMGIERVPAWVAKVFSPNRVDIGRRLVCGEPALAAAAAVIHAMIDALSVAGASLSPDIP